MSQGERRGQGSPGDAQISGPALVADNLRPTFPDQHTSTVQIDIGAVVAAEKENEAAKFHRENENVLLELGLGIESVEKYLMTVAISAWGPLFFKRFPEIGGDLEHQLRFFKVNLRDFDKVPADKRAQTEQELRSELNDIEHRIGMALKAYGQEQVRMVVEFVDAYKEEPWFSDFESEVHESIERLDYAQRVFSQKKEVDNEELTEQVAIVFKTAPELRACAVARAEEELALELEISVGMDGPPVLEGASAILPGSQNEEAAPSPVIAEQSLHSAPIALPPLPYSGIRGWYERNKKAVLTALSVATVALGLRPDGAQVNERNLSVKTPVILKNPENKKNFKTSIAVEHPAPPELAPEILSEYNGNALIDEELQKERGIVTRVVRGHKQELNKARVLRYYVDRYFLYLARQESKDKKNRVARPALDRLLKKIDNLATISVSSETGEGYKCIVAPGKEEEFKNKFVRTAIRKAEAMAAKAGFKDQK